jgi:hypothetical protein
LIFSYSTAFTTKGFKSKIILTEIASNKKLSSTNISLTQRVLPQKKSEEYNKYQLCVFSTRPPSQQKVLFKKVWEQFE